MDIAEKSSDTLSQELNVPTAASTSTTTRSTFPEQQQSADGQASLLSPTTTADNVDTKPVVLGKASSALKGEELTVAKAHVHHGLVSLATPLWGVACETNNGPHSTSADPPSLLCRPLLSLFLTCQVDYLMFQSIIVIILDVKMESLQAL